MEDGSLLKAVVGLTELCESLMKRVEAMEAGTIHEVTMAEFPSLIQDPAKFPPYTMEGQILFMN